MQLNREQTEYLGTFDNVLAKANLRRVSVAEFPNATTATYTFTNCYKRYVGWSGPTQIAVNSPKEKVKKYADGGGFFPTIAGQEVTIKVKSSLNYWHQNMAKHLEPCAKDHLEYVWTSDTTLHVRNLHPEDSILEWNFTSNNFGPDVAVLTYMDSSCCAGQAL